MTRNNLISNPIKRILILLLESRFLWNLEDDKLDELETIADKWLFFMRNVPNLNMMPENFKDSKPLEQAFSLANQATLTTEELDDIERHEMYVSDLRKTVTKAETIIAGADTIMAEAMAKADSVEKEAMAKADSVEKEAMAKADSVEKEAMEDSFCPCPQR